MGDDLFVRAQQEEVPEQAPVSSADGLRGGGGQLPAEVGLVEGAEADAGPAKAVEGLAQAGFVGDGTEHEEGVIVVGREESPGGFQGGVTGLHHLLRVGQVAADEDVDVRPVFYLAELHDRPPLVGGELDSASGGS